MSFKKEFYVDLILDREGQAFEGNLDLNIAYKEFPIYYVHLNSTDYESLNKKNYNQLNQSISPVFSSSFEAIKKQYDIEMIIDTKTLNASLVI